MCYSTEPRDRRYAKGYEFFSFAKNISKNMVTVLQNLQQMQ